MRIRALAALTALLLTGCVTPAGIIDDWRPPQAEGTSGDQRVICVEEDTPPCLTEVVSLNKTRQTTAKKPSPPRRR
ncbi:MAG TPA: hypothetical protein VF111_02830 [Thermoanaerobaculia bacterium]